MTDLLTLVRDGSPTVEVRAPETAGETIDLAAAELVGYVERMSSARLPLTRAELPPNSLWIGPRGAILGDLPECGAAGDGYAIHPVSRGLLIRGRRPRSALFAVYDLLHELGCRWLEPDERNEIVPSTPAPALNMKPRAETPRFPLRGLVHAPSPDRVDWMAKNRMNATIIYGKALPAMLEAGTLDELRRRDMSAEFGHHDFKRYFVDPAKYFEAHPEWFGLRKGVRVGGYRGVGLCLTNPEMEEEFAGNVGELLKTYPWLERVSVWPDDGLMACECDECRRDSSEGRNINDHVLGFVNRVAARFPGIRFSHLVYQSTMRCFPIQERPAPNVDFCTSEIHPGRLSVWRRILDHDRPEGRRSDRLLYIYGYWGGFSGYTGQTRHFPTELAALFDAFEEAGVNGVLTQTTFLYPSAYSTNIFLTGRLAWRNHEGASEAMVDYCRKAFGQWAPLFQEFFEAIDGRHGMHYRELVPEMRLGKYFIDADANNRAVVLQRVRELVRVYERFEPRMDAAPKEAGFAAAPDFVRRERAAFGYNLRGLRIAEAALTGIDMLCMGREVDPENREVLSAAAKLADQSLARGGKLLRGQMEAIPELARMPAMAGLKRIGALMLNGQIQQIDELRRDEVFLRTGLASVSSLSAEELKIVEVSGGEHELAPLARQMAGRDDAGDQLVFRPSGESAFLELDAPVAKSGRLSIGLNAFRGENMGVWRILVNGREATDIDLYHIASEPRDYSLGSFALRGPSCRIRFELVGRHDDAGAAWLVIDRLEMTRHAGENA